MKTCRRFFATFIVVLKEDEMGGLELLRLLDLMTISQREMLYAEIIDRQPSSPPKVQELSDQQPLDLRQKVAGR